MPRLVSAVITTYNRAYIVAKAIDSALAQNYRPIEVIVVDDGSMDDTAAVVARYGDRVRYIRQPKLGLSQARNLGLEAARGEFLALLDSDDAWLPWKIEAQMAILDANPEVGAVWTDMTAVDENGVIVGDRYQRTYYGGFLEPSLARDLAPIGTLGTYWPAAPLNIAGEPVRAGRILSYMLLGNIVHPPTVLLRRKLAHAIGGWNPAIPGGTDYNFLARLSAHGAFAMLDTPALLYRVKAGDQRTFGASTGQAPLDYLATFTYLLAHHRDQVRWSAARLRAHRAAALDVAGRSLFGRGRRAEAIPYFLCSLGCRPRLRTVRQLALALIPLWLYGALQHIKALVTGVTGET